MVQLAKRLMKGIMSMPFETRCLHSVSLSGHVSKTSGFADDTFSHLYSTSGNPIAMCASGARREQAGDFVKLTVRASIER
jgi:hypothetical protein